MSLNPQIVFVAKNAAGTAVQALVDAYGKLQTSRGGVLSRLNISGAVVVKATPGRVAKITVNTAGSTVGTVSDCITTGAVAAANLVFDIPNTAGVYDLDWPCLAGITIVPGTGQVLSVSYT